jgi:hypothetical protein
MAKGKRSTALFDVMYTVRKPPIASSGGGFAMPKWWGKRATKIDPTPPGSPPATSAVPPPAAEIMPVPSVEVQQALVPIVERIEEPRPTMRLVQEADEPVAVDPIEREVRFKLSYGGAAAAAFVLVLLLVIVYLAGSRSEPAEQSITVKPNSSAAANARDNGTGLLAAVVAEPAVSPTDTAAPAASPTIAPNAPAAVVANETPQRQVGMHYVIVQSYPDEKVAQKAADFLNKANIACTVVPGLPGWASPSWYTVVGLKPFDHIQHNQDLEDYKQAIVDAGTKFAGKSLFNRFEPTEYKWRAQTDQ